jgi:hypothetical protein
MSHDLEERVREILSDPELVESLCLELARRAQRGAAQYVKTARLYSDSEALSKVLRTMTNDEVHAAFIRSLEAMTDEFETFAAVLKSYPESGVRDE